MERADAYHQMLRRLGVKREHIHHQASLASDVMVLVHQGSDQDRVARLLGDMVRNPQNDHERCIAIHVIPDVHSVDPSVGPPLMEQKVSSIET